eukprot:g67640.t1
MTDEEEEEWKDLPWNWQDTGRVRVVTSDDQIPEVSEIKRFVKALAKGAEGLQVRRSLITKADGEVDELYCDLFTALEDCIITYATKHKNQFARGIVASFPFISEWMKNMPNFDDSKATTDSSISGLSQASSSSHTSSQPPHAQPLPSEEERSDCAVMMMESEEGESEETSPSDMMWLWKEWLTIWGFNFRRLVEYDIVGWLGKKEATKSLGETPEKKDNLFSVGWSAEPNRESNTDSLTRRYPRNLVPLLRAITPLTNRLH